LRNNNGLISRKEQEAIIAEAEDIQVQNSKLRELVDKSNVDAVNKAIAEKNKAKQEAAELVKQTKSKCLHDTYKAGQKEKSATERANKAEEELKYKTFLAFGLLAFTLICVGIKNEQVRMDFFNFFKVPISNFCSATSDYVIWLINLSDKMGIGWAWLLRIILTLLILAGIFICGCGLFAIIKIYQDRWCTLSLKVMVGELAIITVFGEVIRELLPINLILLFFLLQIFHLLVLWYFDGYYANRYRSEEWKQIQNR
jgi:hypothetical protein